MSWLSRLINVFRAAAVNRDLDEELRFHLDARVDELMRQGLTPADAEARAARQLGNVVRLREQSHEVKLVPWLAELGQTCDTASACSGSLRASPSPPSCRSRVPSAPATRLFLKAGHSVFKETVALFADDLSRRIESRGDEIVAEPVGCQQHGLRPDDLLTW
jgi:hypothetical protein